MQLKCSGGMQSVVHRSFVFLVCGRLIFTGEGYQNSADRRFNTAKLLVLECLDAYELITICHFFQKMWRYMDSYRYAHKDRLSTYTNRLDDNPSRKGLNVHQAAFANKQYKSHRRVSLPGDIIKSLAIKDARKTL